MSPDLRHLNTPRTRFVIIALCVLAYFVVFPSDAADVVSPIATVLDLSNHLAFGLYLVLVALVIAWAIVRAWGRREPRHTLPDAFTPREPVL